MKRNNPSNRLHSSITNKDNTKRIARHKREIEADETRITNTNVAQSANMLDMENEELNHWLEREVNRLSIGLRKT